MVGRTDGRTERSNVSTPSGAAGIYPQTGRKAAAIRLGVPTIRDRTVETAAVLVLEPIFEADLQPEQYAYRRDRSALDAVKHVHKLINTGHGEIVDAPTRKKDRCSALSIATGNSHSIPWPAPTYYS
jgi:hypothetical protein